MRAGDKKSRIRIEVLAVVKNDYGEDQETWGLLREVWAAVRYEEGKEMSDPGGVMSEAFTTFKIDYIAALAPKLHRVRFDNTIYDIAWVQMLGHRESTLLTCRALAIAGIGEGIEGSEQNVAPLTVQQRVRGLTFAIAVPDNTVTPVPFESYAEYAYTINGINNLKTSAGTITLTIYINGVAVTGLSGLAVTSTAQNPTATAGNTVAVGDRVTFSLADNAGAADLEFTMKTTA